MSVRNADNIHWPCPLSAQTKTQLLTIARPAQGLAALGMTSTQTDIQGVAYLTKGVFSLSLSGSRFRNVAGICVGRGDWCGASALGAPHSTAVIHTEELVATSMLLFPRREVFRLAEQDSQVYRWLYAISSSTNLVLGQALANTLNSQEARVAYALLMLVSYLPHITGALPRIDISQQQLSTLTGISRPRLNQTLKLLEQQNEISLLRGSIYLQQPAALMARLDQLEPLFLDPRQRLSAADG